MLPTTSSHTPLAPLLAPPPTLTSVNGMLRVTLPPPLSQKQVRELRRLCRKTANRAQFDGRLIQVRQIASIAAMGTPSAPLFDPATPSSGHLLRLWVDTHRAQGADWRDERPLPCEQVNELRRWDRALKAWAQLRFESSPAPQAPLVPHVPLAPQGLLDDPHHPASPATPFVPKRRQSLSEYTHFSSPVSPDTAFSALSPPTPVSSSYDIRPVYISPSPPPRALRPADHPPAAHVRITRDGDTINITVPALSMLAEETPDESASYAHVDASAEQENLRPAMHAANTAKSWRNSGRDGAQASIARMESQTVHNTMAKTLFGAKGVQRADMDWAKLRRPALRQLDSNADDR